MRLLRGLHNPGIGEEGCVATIGNFDGVHRGHQAIIQRVIDEARSKGVPSVLTLFEPQPLEYFKPDEAPARLMRFREKYLALSSLDLDYLFCLRFDAQLSQLSAEAFIDRVLIDHLDVKHLVVGDDFRFGGDRQGDFALLQRTGQKKGFTVENTPTLYEESSAGAETNGNAKSGKRISSTRIRHCLDQGNFERVEKLLGRPFSLVGRVVRGQALGRQLGFPTANIALHRLNIPLTGVYAVRFVRASGEKLPAIANIGFKPTLGFVKPLLEVHVFNFSGNLYGEHVAVEFCKKIRDEKRFENVDLLKDQIAKDGAVAREYFACG